jgi:hypothetical protein
MQALLLVAERDGPTMFARIGVMKALNRHVERVFDPSRKVRNWNLMTRKHDCDGNQMPYNTAREAEAE